MLNSIFGSKSKSLFINGFTLDVSSESEFHDVVSTQICTKEVAMNLFSAIELIFENDKLVKTVRFEEGEALDSADVSRFMNFTYFECPPNHIRVLEFTDEGVHSLGGEVPPNFVLPVSNAPVPFQYLGCIRNIDPAFKWIPSDLHLVCPIFLNFSKCFIDYADPNKPIVINTAELEQCDSSFDELNQQTEIVYEKASFEFIEADYFTNDGHAGIPEWVQYPEIPHCPRSNKRMKFVCQLTGGVSAVRTNVIPNHKEFSPYFEKLNFWGDGILYVFFEPDSKTTCYLIQNT